MEQSVAGAGWTDDMAGPNILRAAASAVWALRVARPTGSGAEAFDHGPLAPILEQLAMPDGMDNVNVDALSAYGQSLSAVDPSLLWPDEELAFWLNAYNAFAVILALDVSKEGLGSVLELKSGFNRTVASIGGERLSLTDIEHGKIRRFKDPRIHGSLVCGSLSCPTLRPEPFEGSRVRAQLDDQMTRFVAGGGAVVDEESATLSLSRVFLWYGSDFVRPRRMPTLVPASSGAVGRAMSRWLNDHQRDWFERVEPAIEFQDYDWGLGCTVA